MMVVDAFARHSFRKATLFWFMLSRTVPGAWRCCRCHRGAAGLIDLLGLNLVDPGGQHLFHHLGEIDGFFGSTRST